MTRGMPLPDPLALRKHLDGCTVVELEEFLRFWSPHFKGTNGRAQLVDELYRLMSDENVVYAKVDLLSEKVRAVLLQLLKKMHYVCDLPGLFRGIDGLEMEFYEAEAALTALARRGFVRQSRGQEWVHHGRSSYSIPRETALVMRGLAGTDRRPLAQVFTHARFRPSGVEATAMDEEAPLPGAVTDALGELPQELRTIATEVIEQFGGIITRREFGERFGSRRIVWNSGRFLGEFGRRGLGTVGHLDLRARGIGVDDDALFFFLEVVDRYTEEWRSRPLTPDLVRSGHGDLMSDVTSTLAEVRDAVVKVSKEGTVYKTARSRIAEKLGFRAQPMLDKTEVADRALAVARRLGLAERNGEGQLAVTEKGEEWAARPLLDKLRDAYGLVLNDGVQTLRSRHLRRVQPILVEMLTGLEEGAWWPGTSAAMLARNRYLLELEAEEPTSSRPPLSIRHAAVTELGRAAQDLLSKDFFALGLLDVALRDEKPIGLRLSRLGRRLLLDQESAGGESKPLVVNPDFEVLVFPEGDIDDLLHALDRFAVRENTGQVVHYRLDRERIERAAVSGTTPEEVIAFLAEHARAELPQNVVYSIRSWSDAVRSGTLERGLLFVASDPAIVQTVTSHPLLKDCVVRVVEPNMVFFDERVMERQIVSELRSLGIYVR